MEKGSPLKVSLAKGACFQLAAALDWGNSPVERTMSNESKKESKSVK
jgi:hypothetical protein